MNLPSNLQLKFKNLQGILNRYQRVLVAFSGGLDSSFLAAVAHQTLGHDNVFAITAESDSLAQHDRFDAQRIVKEFGIQHQWVTTEETKDPRYTANTMHRCFYCKSTLFEKLAPIAHQHKMILVDGYTASDRTDIRPGHVAANNYQTRHPLDESDLYKSEMRLIAQLAGFSFWDKPASPCLSSRIPHGTAVQPDILEKIDRAEQRVRSFGFRVVRVRHHGETATLEVGRDELPKAQSLYQEIKSALQSAGYRHFVLDMRGYKSGSHATPPPVRT